MASTSCNRQLCLGLVGLSGLLAGCGAFEYYGPIPNLRKIVEVKDHDLGRLEVLRISKQSISAEAAREIRIATNVRRVIVEDCIVSDGSKLFESIGELPHLDALTIHGTAISDSDLAGLEAATKLQFVEFLGSELRGDGLRSLSKLPITSLTFNSTRGTAEALQCLADFEQLEELYLNVTGLELQQMPSLRKLTRLKSITLLNFTVSTEAKSRELAFLEGLDNLEQIYLSSYMIDDEMMQALGQFASLKSIEILDNSITNEGIFELESLPHLKTFKLWDARQLTRESLLSIARHQELETLSLCGALIPIRETALLECLPKLVEADVGMTDRELKEAIEEGESLVYNQNAIQSFRSVGPRRSQQRPSSESSM